MDVTRIARMVCGLYANRLWTGASPRVVCLGQVMNEDQRTVLHFLTLGWKLRHRRGWRLKQPDYVDNFEDCPGGQVTIDELRTLGYIDERNNITEGGVKAFAALEAKLSPPQEK